MKMAVYKMMLKGDIMRSFVSVKYEIVTKEDHLYLHNSEKNRINCRNSYKKG